MFRTRITIALALAAAVLPTLWCKTAPAATLVGNALIPRANVDTCPACLFIQNQAFSGGPVTGWSFFGTNPNDSITPILLNLSGNTFTITGIGAPVSGVSGNSGLLPFAAVQGSNIATSSTYFGWVDNNPNGIGSFPGGGSIPYDNGGGLGTY